MVVNAPKLIIPVSINLEGLMLGLCTLIPLITGKDTVIKPSIELGFLLRGKVTYH